MGERLSAVRDEGQGGRGKTKRDDKHEERKSQRAMAGMPALSAARLGSGPLRLRNVVIVVIDHHFVAL